VNFEVRRLGPGDGEEYTLFAFEILSHIPREDGADLCEEIDFTPELVSPLHAVWGMFLGESLIGVVKFCRQGTLHWDSHVGILPLFRGKKALRFVQQALFELRVANPGPSLIVTATIPWPNKRARAFVKALGAHYVGQLPFTWVEDGKRYSKVIYARELP
jgi:hypothetical protein